jgi:hypothetical protein
MIEILHTTLFAIYSAIFPWLFGEGPGDWIYDDGMTSDTQILRTTPHWSFERVGPWLRLNLYIPLFRPVFWWRQTRFLNAALGQIRRVDPDL